MTTPRNQPLHTDDNRYCGDCGEGLYDSGCAAPGCPALACQDCGTGCTLDFSDEGPCVDWYEREEAES